MPKTSLFTGGKRSVAGTLTRRSQGRPATPDIDNAVEALEERASARQRIPDVALEIACPCIDSDQRPTIYRKDFGLLVEQYPHHQVLINQLLVGAESARAGSRSCTTPANLYVSLWEFVTFLNDDRFGLNPMPVMVIADISPSVCLAFSVYLVKMYPRRTLNRHRYSAVGRIVFQMQRGYADNPDIGDTLYWPAGPRKITSPTDGYPSEVMGSLVDGCLKDIRAVMHAHDRAQVVTANGEQIRGEEITLENIMWWVARLSPALQTVDHLARQPFVKDFCEMQGISPIDLMVTFHDQGEALAAHGAHPLGTPIRWPGATTDERIRLAEMVVATFARRFPAYPFGMSFEDVKEFYAGRHAASLKAGGGSLFERKLLRAFERGIALHGIGAGKEAYFSYRHFTVDSLYASYLLVQINTGWNPQAVLSLTDDVDAHVTTDLLDPDNYVVIRSWKGRTAKPVYHRSNRHNEFGVYRILKYVEKVVTDYRDSPHYLPGTLWQYVAAPTGWTRSPNLLHSAGRYFLGAGSQSFIARHQIRIVGKDGQETRLDHKRIRASYVTMREMLGWTAFDLQSDLGHADVDTTSAHYMSDATSIREWLTWWPYKIADVAGVAGEGPLVELTAIPSVDEELDRAAQRVD